MLSIAKTVFVTAAFLAVVAFYGWQERLISQQPPRMQPSPQKAWNTAENQKTADGVKEIAGPTAFLYFFTPGGLQKIADYCGSEANGKPDKWLRDKFICEGRATDIVTAVASVLLVIVTAGLIWVAVSQMRTTKRQLRAYVSAIPDFVSSFKVDECPTAIFKIRNIGVTPARNVRHRGNVIVIQFPPPKDYRLPKLTQAFSSPVTAFPNLPYDGNSKASKAFTQDDIAHIRAGSARILVYGEITYKDIFRFTLTRTTMFCGSVVADANTLKKMTSDYLPSDLKIKIEAAPIGNYAT